MEFFEKVQLALAFGINAELQPALNAIGNLRNKFAHKLDMKIGEEEANNLIATFRGPSKQRLQALLQELANVPSARKVTSEEVARSKVQAFFIQLFDEVGDERLRLAMEKMRHWTADC
jgi:hypothetical protein